MRTVVAGNINDKIGWRTGYPAGTAQRLNPGGKK
jgi:hypothetical protein